MPRSLGASTSTSLGSDELGSKVKVVANLPYNITKEFLKAMLPMGTCVSDLHIMIQVNMCVAPLLIKVVHPMCGRFYRVSAITLGCSWGGYR